MSFTKWNLNDFTKIDSFIAHKGFVLDLKLVSSSQLVSASSYIEIKLWDLDTNECLMHFDNHREDIFCVEISSDKSKLYSCSWDHTFKIWDISSGKCLKSIDLDCPIYCFKFLSSNLIAVGLNSINENLQIIDLRSYEIVKTLETKSRYVSSLNFDSDKNVLFAGDNKVIQMWQF